MLGENYVQCLYIAQGDVILHVSEEVIMATLTIEPIRLRYSQKDELVLIETATTDRFSLTVEEAIEACRIYEERKTLFHEQFNNLLSLLGKWTYSHKSKIKDAFLTIRNTRLLFLIVTKRKTYDEELEKELTDLDMSIACEPDFSEIPLSVQALPYCDEAGHDSFCKPEWTLEYSLVNAR